MLKVLENATIYTGNEIIENGLLVIEDEKISYAGRMKELPRGALVTDCRNLYISHGFIDLQIAGAGGYLFSSHTEAPALEKISESITLSGTSRFLLVLPTNKPGVYKDAIQTVRENPHPALLGLHLEGPFISHAKRGAHVPEYIRKPDLKELSDLLKEGEGVIKMMTVAPEVCFPGFISLLNDHGIVVCAGHSNATYAEATEGFRWGINATTHLFNAMSSFHHRDPGLPGATFLAEDKMASIVADGVHVSYDALTVAKRIMKERLYLISDAVEENRMGQYQHVRQSDRFTLPDGTLSGSTLTMMKAVKNCIEKAGFPADEALRMATVYPARLMKLPGSGAIAAGVNANLTLFDRNYEVKSVYKDGVEITNLKK